MKAKAYTYNFKQSTEEPGGWRVISSSNFIITILCRHIATRRCVTVCPVCNLRWRDRMQYHKTTWDWLEKKNEKKT